jgi:hypothetical protein
MLLLLVSEAEGSSVVLLLAPHFRRALKNPAWTCIRLQIVAAHITKKQLQVKGY